MNDNPHGEGQRLREPLRAIAQRLAGGGASAFARAFNHLLRQNDWARARLVPFAGRRVSIVLEARPLARLGSAGVLAQVTGDGLLDTGAKAAAGESAAGEAASEAPLPREPATGAAPPGQAGEAARFDAQMHVRPSFAAPGSLVGEGARGLAPYVRVDGEAMLCAALVEVAEGMRWDPEEDLSRVTGDVLARRIGRAVGAASDAMRGFRARFAGSAGRRFAAASRTLVARDELESLRATLDALEDRLAKLEAKRRPALD
ncbi:MAG: hypothetical protein M9885_07555 [Burkholderiaceae bacterium]|nr:hypothetical protein [Burkholderiaceae bacterium]